MEQYPEPPENVNGYCPDHSTGVSCPIGLGVNARVVQQVRRWLREWRWLFVSIGAVLAIFVIVTAAFWVFLILRGFRWGE